MNRNFSKKNFERLNARLSQLVEKGEAINHAASLIHLFLTQRFYAEKISIDEAIVEGGNDCGVDAVYIDRSGGEPIVNIIQSKVHSSERKAANKFKSGDIERISRFFEVVADDNVRLDKVANAALAQKVLEVRSVIEREFPVFRVWCISNGLPSDEVQSRPALQALAKYDAEFREFHLDDFVEFCLDTHSQRLNHTFWAKDAGVVEMIAGNLRSVTGFISGAELFQLLKSLGDDKIDYSIFDMNVRGFLGFDNSVNRDISRTAASRSNDLFHALNNGITIVCQKVKVNRNSGKGAKIGLKRMSIVNGAQTSHAIFDAMRAEYPNLERFEKLTVLFRIFETEDADLISRISLSTNSQTRISPRDLRSNDDAQRRLEVDLKSLGVKYLRKRRRDESEKDQDFQREIDALRAGQLILSFHRLAPVRAKRESDIIFSDYYDEIFSNISAKEIVEAMDWYDLIEERRKEALDDVRIRGAHSTPNAFITYAGFHILMLCSLLKDEGIKPVDKRATIDRAITIIAERLDDLERPAYYTFFRDQRQADYLKDAVNQPRLF